MRGQNLLSAVLTELRKQLPFALLGLDTDNDTVFMNETLKKYCEQAAIVFTRCRPYRKNDQATDKRNVSNHWQRSTMRQRTTPWITGVGPSSTMRASAAR